MKKELVILRKAIDKNENKIKKKKKTSVINDIIDIVEQFIIKKKRICYGGTAINNILPDQEQFYNKDMDIPDYDFFSPTPLEDSIRLANLYYKKGFKEVQASAGMHYGTYKVFVNFTPIADITLLPKNVYNSLLKNSFTINNINYAPPNFLRMSMYLELSRPEGDISRWEKILKRLVLLNNYFPLKQKNCKNIEFLRPFYKKNMDSKNIFNIVHEALVKQDVVFFGGFATSLYSDYMPSSFRKKIEANPDFDVLANHPENVCLFVKNYLKTNNIQNVKIKKHKAIGDIIPDHYEIIIDEDTVAFIYQTKACYSYNTYKYKKNTIKIATIDTMLSFYLAFIYVDKSYYDVERLLCMSHYLFIVQQKNRLSQKGLLKRFTDTCYGTQLGKEDIREIKQNKYRELKQNNVLKKSKKYQKWFLKYDPSIHMKNNITTKKKSPAKKKNNTKKKKKT